MSSSLAFNTRTPTAVRTSQRNEGPLSIFDLPPILDRLFYFMDRPSLLACSLASQAWSAIFTPELWRDINLTSSRRSFLVYNSSPPFLLHKYAQHFRILTCRGIDVLTRLSVNCTQLRAVSFIQSMDWSLYHAELHTKTLAQFLRRNPLLQSFATAAFPFHSEADTRVLMEALSSFPHSPTVDSPLQPGLQSLRSVKLTYLIHGRCRPEALTVLFKHFPLQVTSLTLSVGTRRLRDDDQDFRQRLVKDGAFRERMDMTRLEDTALETLVFEESNLQGYEESILFAFLKRCPMLVKFQVPDILPAQALGLKRVLERSCPGLREVVLDPFLMDAEHSDEHLAKLVMALPRVSCFRLNCVRGPGLLVSAALQDFQVYSTLERIEFRNCQPGPSSQLLQRIVSTCTGLKVLSVRDGRRLTATLRERDGAARSLDQQVVGMEAWDVVQEPWACTGLEYLEMVIKNVPRPDSSPSIMDGSSSSTTSSLLTTTSDSPKVRITLACAESHRLQQRIFLQLGALNSLHTLILSPQISCDVRPPPLPTPAPAFAVGAGNTNMIPPALARTFEPNQHGCLEFTLASGLGHLGSLWRLRKLDLRRMGHGISVQELEWIGGHWRNLRELYGIGSLSSLEEAEMWTVVEEDEVVGDGEDLDGVPHFKRQVKSASGGNNSRWGEWVKARIDRYAETTAFAQLKAKRHAILFEEIEE